MGGMDRGWPLARGLCPRRQPSTAAARPGWLRLLRDAPSVHTRRGPCRASPFLPCCRHHALPFSPAPTGKLAVHYIRNVNAGAPGRPAPGGEGGSRLPLLHPSGSGRPARREGRAAFRGNTGPPCLTPPSLGPPPSSLLAPPASGLSASTSCRGRRELPEPGLRGEGCSACACVPAALQWQLPSRRLLTLALQCSRS